MDEQSYDDQTKRVTFVTHDVQLVQELKRDYYLLPRLVVSSLSDVPLVFAHHPHRRWDDALVVNLAEFPELEGVEPPDFAPVVFIGGEEGTLKIETTAEEVAAALGARRRPRARSLVYAVMSPNIGGCGKTTLSMNLARLASGDGATLAIEADLHGRLRYLLPADIPPDAPGLYEVCEQGAGTIQSLKPYVQRIRDVDWLLAPAGRHEGVAKTIDARALGHVIQRARMEYDNIIVEFAAIPSGSDIALLHANAVLVAMKMEPGATENLRNLVLGLERMEGVPDRMGLVVLTRGDTESLGALRLPVLAQIPFEPMVDQIRNEREFVVDQARRVPKVAQALRDCYGRVGSFVQAPIVFGERTEEERKAA